MQAVNVKQKEKSILFIEYNDYPLWSKNILF